MNKKKIHLKDNGDPVKCEADKRSCPKRNVDGTVAEHYETKDAARKAFEKMMKNLVVVPHVMNLPKDIEEIFELLDLNDAQGHIVGGAVRDSLLSEVTPKDIDIEVQGVESIDELARLLRKGNYAVDEVGKAFAVLTLRTKSGIDVDISLPRRDNHVGAGHKGFDVEVSPELSLPEAALRRDFTINALYYNPKNKTIIDTHGGLKDWKEKRLRHVSDAFSEDPLRVLRAAQFSARFGLTIDKRTALESIRISNSFHELPVERVRGEWSKLLKSKNLSKGIAALQGVGWAKYFGVEDIDTKGIKDGLGLSHELTAMAIARELPAEKRSLFLNYALHPKDAATALRRSELTPPGTVTKESLYKFSRELGRNSLTLREWTKMNETFHGQNEDMKHMSKSMGILDGVDGDFITGEKILSKTGLRGGKWVGDILSEARKAQDESIFTTEDGASGWLNHKLDEMGINGS